MASPVRTASLTPYDTGARLEPHVWPANYDPDRLGRVDFDDDEGATVLSLHAERRDDGSHELLVIRVSDAAPLALNVDGERAVAVRPESLSEEDH